MNMMKCKIGTALILILLVFLALITNANAEETTKVYSIRDIIDFKKQGWETSIVIGFELPNLPKLTGRTVGENIMIEGIASVSLTKNNQTLSGPISCYPFLVQVYKDGGDVDVLFEATDDNGEFRVDFTPKEPGYYKMVWKSGYDWLPIKYPFLDDFLFYFYVSEKDSDDDGVPDQYDYDPYDSNVQTRSDIKTPAFEAIFAIAGLLAVTYLLRRRR